MAVATAGAATEATTTIGADRSLCRSKVAAERRRLVGTVAIPITGHCRWTTAERAIAGGMSGIATTGQRHRATSAAESDRRARIATIATAETTESAALPTAATMVDVMRSSLLPPARRGALPSRSEGRTTSLAVAAMPCCSTAPSSVPGRTTGQQ